MDYMKDTFDIEDLPNIKIGDILYFRAALRCLKVSGLVSKDGKIVTVKAKVSSNITLTSPIEHCRKPSEKELKSFNSQSK